MDYYACENCGIKELEYLEMMYCGECIEHMKSHVVNAFMSDAEFREKYPDALKVGKL